MSEGKIRQLSNEVIGQIAAGEVVERPAAAIKELVENCMDAGASAITVDVRDGGLTSFRVVDNGCGIAPLDIRLAFARHATSKIRESSDLYGVQTLGFRGEALASIAAVAHVTCTTRVRGAEYGVSVQNNGGELGEIKEAACPEGTSFIVKDLFFNAPVRRKFLKKPSTETAYISDLMMRFILSHPQISFRYIADGKTIYFSAGDGKLDSAVLSIYGLQTLENLRRVSGNMSGVLLEGYVGIGDMSRGNRSHQSFMLNGRLIKSNLLTAALEDACRQRVMIGRFPMCVLHLTMPFESVDVNVHPNKWEVRFQNEAAIREAVRSLVFDALQDATPLDAALPLFDREPEVKSSVTLRDPPAAPLQSDTAVESKEPQKPVLSQDHFALNQPYQSVKPASAPAYIARSAPVSDSVPAFSRDAFTPRSNTWDKAPVKPAPVQTPPAESPQPVPPKPAPLPVEKKEEPQVEQVEQLQAQVAEKDLQDLPVRMIGVVFNTYIILECRDRMLLCDQHAVHERLLYEEMMKACADDSACQVLMVPSALHLTYREYTAFLENTEVLRKSGFDVSDFGDLTVQVRGVPLILGAAQSEGCLIEALDDLADNGQISHEKKISRIIQSACKHAVKGGEKLPLTALTNLVRKMIVDNVTPTCPHGRPLIIEVTQRDLEKRFRRIQD